MQRFGRPADSESEWLSFPGRTPVKAGSEQHSTKPNKKDFLVRLSSLKDELAHRAPMPLKSLTLIVRQISLPEAGKVKG
ncbi:hypothetical protein RND59_18065 [Vibrio ruber]|uniref:hypothetical protein n=1 Tax=Vibrio ruber TaxID=184755 RepID=UPI0028933F00|nr:hypothetical protein [Vibrio ruber]WNJ98021.1 hypothetical protein RND59_18065 [Vibrio ruber]